MQEKMKKIVIFVLNREKSAIFVPQYGANLLKIKIVDIKPTQLLNGSDEMLTIPVVTEPEELIEKEEDVW